MWPVSDLSSQTLEAVQQRHRGEIMAPKVFSLSFYESLRIENGQLQLDIQQG